MNCSIKPPRHFKLNCSHKQPEVTHELFKLFLHNICLVLVPYVTQSICQCFHLKGGCWVVVFLPSSAIQFCFYQGGACLSCDASDWKIINYLYTFHVLWPQSSGLPEMSSVHLRKERAEDYATFLSSAILSQPGEAMCFLIAHSLNCLREALIYVSRNGSPCSTSKESTRALHILALPYPASGTQPLTLTCHLY